MKKILTLSSLFVMLASVVFAQGNAETPQDPKAKVILDKLAEKQKSYESFSADFKYQLKGKDLDEEQSGKLKVRDKKYRLILGETEIINDSKSMYTVIDKVELQINCLPDEEDENNFMNPAALPDMYSSGFKYVHEKVIDINGRKADVVKLFPMDPKDKAFHTLIITVFQDNNELHAMQILNKDGNIYTITLSNLNGNAGLQESDFVIDEDDYEDVIDLREDC